MIVTEHEAREKWCPHARVIEYGGETVAPPSNRTVLTDEQSGEWESADDAPCVASRCMAWRWWGYRDGEGTQCEDHRELRGAVARVGYCGLAGKP